MNPLPALTNSYQLMCTVRSNPYARRFFINGKRVSFSAFDAIRNDAVTHDTFLTVKMKGSQRHCSRVVTA